jgi:hypothetical protein
MEVLRLEGPAMARGGVQQVVDVAAQRTWQALIFSAVAVQSSGMRIVSIFSGHFVHETSFV